PVWRTLHNFALFLRPSLIVRASDLHALDGTVPECISAADGDCIDTPGTGARPLSAQVLRQRTGDFPVGRSEVAAAGEAFIAGDFDDLGRRRGIAVVGGD